MPSNPRGCSSSRGAGVGSGRARWVEGGGGAKADKGLRTTKKAMSSATLLRFMHG